jgi:branched-chain amino acid transport system permease protein
MTRWIGVRYRAAGGGSLLVAVAVLVCAAVIPAFATSSLMSLIDIMFIYTIASYAVAFLYGYGGQMSVAHAALFGIAAYITGYSVTHYRLPLVVVVVLSAAGATVAAFLVGCLSLRLKGHYFVITTFAFVEVVNTLFTNLTDLTNGSLGMQISPAQVSFAFMAAEDLTAWYRLLVVLVGVVILFFWILARSPYGRRLESTKENEDLARAVGINTTRSKTIAFMISGAVTGLAGSLYALFYMYLEPSQFDYTLSVTFVEILILGGATAVFGPLIGGVLVVVLPGVLNVSPTLSEVMLGALFIAFILLLPDGVAGGLSKLRWAAFARMRLRPAATQPMASVVKVKNR